MDCLKNIENADNLSVVLHSKDDIRLEQWPIPHQLEPNGMQSAILELSDRSTLRLILQNVYSKRTGIHSYIDLISKAGMTKLCDSKVSSFEDWAWSLGGGGV